MQYGIKSVSYFGANIRDLLPGEIKYSCYFSVFKHRIRKWISEKLACQVCQAYILKSAIFDFSQLFASLSIVFLT